jgi:hypothetical protein
MRPSTPWRCFPCYDGSLQDFDLRKADVPEHGRVVRIGYSWMPIIVLDVDVVHLCLHAGQCIEGLASPELPKRDHIDRAYQIALAVIGQKRARRESCGVNVERAEAREVIGQLGKRAQLLIVAAGWGLQP